MFKGDKIKFTLVTWYSIYRLNERNILDEIFLKGFTA